MKFVLSAALTASTLVTVIAPARAEAATMLITDRDVFSVGSKTTTANLDGVPAGSYGFPGSLDTGLINVATSSPLFVQSNNIFGTGSFLSAQQQQNPVVTFSFDNPVTAFGFDYYSGFASTLTINGQTFDIAANTSFPVLQFAGVLSNTPFSTATLNVFSGADIDNLSAGSVSAVPEPATWAMMIFGFGAVGAAMRSKRRTGDGSFRAYA